MAEFSRKSRSKRILESIDTKKSSKREVYDFYKRWRKQYGAKGKALDIKQASKADIIRELYQLEAHQHGELQNIDVKRFEQQYEKVKEQIKTPSKEAADALKKLQAKAAKLEKAGKIAKGKANIFQETTEQPKPRHRTEQKTGRKQRTNRYYKGRFAHDFIKKMCDDGLIDTDDFEDSQEIWYAIDLLTLNSDEFDFFDDHYEGEYKKGSRDYYLGDGGFDDFLKAQYKFEAAMKAEGKEIPERLTDEYWKALKAWLNEIGGITRL